MCPLELRIGLDNNTRVWYNKATTEVSSSITEAAPNFSSRRENTMTTWNELTEAEQLLNNYSDDYKDKFGFRPRGLTPEQVASVEWLKDAIDGLSDFNEDGDLPVDGNYDEEDDGQPSEYEEYQDFYGGDEWDQGQYDDF